MMLRRLLAAAAVSIPALSIPALSIPAAAAQEKGGPAWGPPTADYRADMVFTDDRGRSRTARLYYTAKRQRLEFKSGKQIVAMIFDKRGGQAIQLLLSQRGWRPVAAAAPQFNFGLSDPASKRETLAEETLAGRAVTKFRVSSRTNGGDTFDGLAWATKQRIVVRMAGTVVRGSKQQPLTMELQNLKIGPVDAALFAVPAGYRRLPPLKE